MTVSSPKDSFIPNAYQTPNAYCDRLMYLLTPSEWKVLSYAVRRIFGFQKRQDHISLSQFVHGTLSQQDGSSLDHGTGLNKATVVSCLEALMRYHLITRLSSNDPVKNEGDLYSLQLDYDRVDYAGLIERANQSAASRALKTSAARSAAEGKRLSPALPGLSNRPGSPVCPTDQTRSVQQTTPGLSNRPPLVCPTDTQYTGGKTEENKGKGASLPNAAQRPDASVTAGHAQTWDQIVGELIIDLRPETIQVRINPNRLLSVNGRWTVAVPDPLWWKTHMDVSVRRVYHGLTDQQTEFDYVEMIP